MTRSPTAALNEQIPCASDPDPSTPRPPFHPLDDLPAALCLAPMALEYGDRCSGRLSTETQARQFVRPFVNTGERNPRTPSLAEGNPLVDDPQWSG